MIEDLESSSDLWDSSMYVKPFFSFVLYVKIDTFDNTFDRLWKRSDKEAGQIRGRTFKWTGRWWLSRRRWAYIHTHHADRRSLTKSDIHLNDGRDSLDLQYNRPRRLSKRVRFLQRNYNRTKRSYGWNGSRSRFDFWLKPVRKEKHLINHLSRFTGRLVLWFLFRFW